MIARLPAALLCALAVVVAGPAVAFDSAEHERAAENAILLAFAYWLAGNGRDSVAADDDICVRLQQAGFAPAVTTLVRHCSVGSKAVTYGGLVRLVDELNYPSQIFVQEGTANVDPTSPARKYPESWLDLNEHFRRRFEEREGNTRRARFFQGVRALSFNEVHFQNDLTQQLQRLRRDALAIAPHNLYGALVTNALSDHFLQDFFAPGHLLWPRNHSHDSVAVSLHDGANRAGATFSIDLAFWRRYLEPIAAYAETLPPSSATYRELNRYWLKRQSGRPAICSDGAAAAGELAGNVSEGLACLRRGLAADGRITMHGDGQLSMSPAEQALLLIVQAERIVQLLRASRQLDYREAPGMHEIRSFTPGYRVVIVPCPVLEFGRVLFHERSCDKFDFGDPDRKDAETAKAQRIADEVFRHRVKGVYLLGGGGQAPFRSVGSARYQFSLEHIPLGLMANTRMFRNNAIHKPPDACDFFSRCNVGFAYGIDYVHDGDFTAPGIGFRVIKAIPSVSLQLSPYVKYLKYRFAQGDDWNVSWGLRLDWGFSLGSLYVALGKEFFVNEFGELQSTGMASFGGGIGIPRSRIRKWFFDNRHYRPKADRLAYEKK